MSHYSVLVNAGPCSVDQLVALDLHDIYDRVAEPLVPYFWHPDMWGEPGDAPRPRDAVSTWDWFLIGGRWRGHFVARSGNPIVGSPGVPESIAISDGVVEDRLAELRRQRRTDVVVAGDIDLEAMRTLWLAEGAAWYDRCVLSGQALDSKGLTPSQMSREDYLARVARSYSPATHAICDANGWRESPKGPTPQDEEAGWPAWEARWHEYVDSLDADTLLVLVDCHE